MSASGSGSESVARSSALDWNELSGLERIVSAYSIGDQTVVVETADNREIRITAWYDRARDNYVAEYERRSVLKSGGHDFRVWAQTPAYKRCTADDAASCLEAAVLEVDRINIY
ncbi:MAG: hypothetical protein E6G02_11695 [Actinobacteria bacterium]|nr:MAG: hypothetical protein E6G02_11695 [Actinomycetota bacterium]